MTVCDNWQMICPACGKDSELDIQASVWVRLVSDGTDADEAALGDHEWDASSPCSCSSCGWTGTVATTELAYKWMEYGVAICRDEAGYWSWAETDDTAERNINGPFSPPFKELGACISDLEQSFGPLPE